MTLTGVCLHDLVLKMTHMRTCHKLHRQQRVTMGLFGEKKKDPKEQVLNNFSSTKLS